MTIIETKICGITNTEDAIVACEAGADAIGLNFYPKSKRFVKVDVARQIADVTAGKVAIFGVFVNASVEDICQCANNVGLTHIQLHGDESPEVVAQIRAQLESVKIVRAIRTRDSDLEGTQSEIDRWKAAAVDLLLLDAAAEGVFGGSGETLDWGRVGTLKFPVPWLLAGGLGPDNVTQAIELARPDGVDVASGVESEPRKKHSDMVREFVSAANQSLNSKQ